MATLKFLNSSQADIAIKKVFGFFSSVFRKQNEKH